MEHSEKNDKELTENKKALTQEAKGLWSSLMKFLVELLDFRADTDRENTIDAIVKDIPFKGATAWILVCSIFVASIGLNANSTAVIIGAMLISPLMGPILGMGLSLAINDIDTLKKSLINFGVMVVLSVFTAFLFFWFFPLREESSELLARTQPDIRDVLIAFFGGLALMIARTKKGTIASVIFGVAIATALMPPLCTVGYGLAEASIGNSKGFGFAIGALYLFIINTIFIGLATFLVIKLLRFPMIKYANSTRRKRIARFASLVAIVVMIFPAYTFYNVLQETRFKNDVQRFIENELNALPNASYIKKYATYHYDPKKESTIEITSFGDQQIDETTMEVLRARLKDYKSLGNTQLLLNQHTGENDLENEMRYMAELRSRDSVDINSKAQKIAFLESEVAKLSKLEKEQIPFKDLCDEAKINYQNLKSLSYSSTLISNFEKIDTLKIFETQWKESAGRREIESEKSKLTQWLKYKLKLDTLVVK